MRNLSPQRLFVQALHVTFRQDLDGAFHVNLDEVLDRSPHLIADRAVRRDGRRTGDYTVAGEQRANKPDPPDIEMAIFLAEAEALGKVRANDVAVQKLHLGAG